MYIVSPTFGYTDTSIIPGLVFGLLCSIYFYTQEKKVRAFSFGGVSVIIWLIAYYLAYQTAFITGGFIPLGLGIGGGIGAMGIAYYYSKYMGDDLSKNLKQFAITGTVISTIIGALHYIFDEINGIFFLDEEQCVLLILYVVWQGTIAYLIGRMIEKNESNPNTASNNNTQE